MYMYMCVCAYIHIYIYNNNEYIYIYIYIYTHMRAGHHGELSRVLGEGHLLVELVVLGLWPISVQY